MGVEETRVKLRLALAQIRCEKGDWPGNLACAEQYMAQAAQQGCDLIVFPEASLSGYFDPTRFPESIQTLDSPWIERFVSATRQYQIAASGGFIETNPSGAKPLVTQVLAQGGDVLGVYRKTHHVEGDEELFEPDPHTPTFILRLSEGTLRCALAICSDDDRPDLFAAFAEGGARIVFHSSAPGLYGRRTDEASWRAGYDWYKSHLAGRLPIYARDYDLYIAVATQTGATVDEDFPGGSFVFGPDGNCLAQSGGFEETLLVHELDFPDNS